METKETLNKRMLQHLGLAWDVKGMRGLHPLARLMLDALGGELLLLDGKLEEMDASVAGKLVKRLLPARFNYVRPSHGILQVCPTVPACQVGKYTDFSLKGLPATARGKKLAAATFTPVTDTPVYRTGISHIFTGKEHPNTVWLALSADPGIHTLENTALYLDFAHLPDHHDCYELVSGSKWYFRGKRLEVMAGFPVAHPQGLTGVEKEVLEFYKGHYQTILSPLELGSTPPEGIPDGLAGAIGEAQASSLPPAYWISVEFPPGFAPGNLKSLSVELNTFPVINRQHVVHTVYKGEFGSDVSLVSRIGQEFLEVEPSGDYTCEAEPVQRRNVEDRRIIDCLDRLADTAQDERAAFPDIDNEKIAAVLEALSGIQDQDTGRIVHNRLKEFAEVARLRLHPTGEVESIQVSYWTTHGELANGIPPGTKLSADKVQELNKSDAALLRATSGGRNFFSPDSLKAISGFHINSRGRILSRHDIAGFCRLELGQHLEKADVVRKADVSHRKGEGIRIVMEIQITPRQGHAAYFRQKGVFKDLLMRLQKRSPGNYEYRVRVMGEE